MFEDIFKKWIETNQLNNDDVIAILLEYDATFNEGKTTPQELMLLLQHPIVQMSLEPAVIKALCLVAIKKGIVWTEIYNNKNQLVARFIN